MLCLVLGKAWWCGWGHRSDLLQEKDVGLSGYRGFSCKPAMSILSLMVIFIVLVGAELGHKPLLSSYSGLPGER